MNDVGYFLVSNDHLMMIVCMQGGCSRTLSDAATMVLPIMTKGMPIAKKMMATLERSERERERERERAANANAVSRVKTGRHIRFARARVVPNQE